MVESTQLENQATYPGSNIVLPLAVVIFRA